MMKDYGTRLAMNTRDASDELTPERVKRLRQWRRRLIWRRRSLVIAARTALPGALLLALAIAVSVPLPVKAATLGAAWSTHISAAGSTIDATGDTATIAWRDRATARVAFSGRLLPAARRAIVTVTLRQAGRSGDTTIGSVMLRAERVFNTPATALPALFAEMGVTPHPATRYTLTIASGTTTLTHASLALTR